VEVNGSTPFHFNLSHMELYVEGLKITGAIFGLVAFFWKLWDFLWAHVFAHLQLHLEVSLLSPALTKISTEIENKGSTARKVHFAFLLISPEGVGLSDALKKITPTGKDDQLPESIPLMLRKLMRAGDEPIGNFDEKDYHFCPLPYFYREQMQVGNEKIKYATSVSNEQFAANKTYTVRFVMISLHLMRTYLRYRSTSDILFKPKEN